MNLSNIEIKFWEYQELKLRAAGREARLLPLCNAGLPSCTKSLMIFKFYTSCKNLNPLHIRLRNIARNEMC